jgi:hypothetical protein
MAAGSISPDYDSLPAPLRARIDEAARKTVLAFDGALTLDEARSLVLEHLLERTVSPDHGTGH